MIAFDIDIDRIAQAVAVLKSACSPVRGRWDTGVTHLLSMVPPARESPAAAGKLQQTAPETVWRNLDLRFSAEEPVGSGNPS